MAMSKVTTDPWNGLQMVEFSHEWDQRAPSYPGQADVKMTSGVKHAQHGVLAWRAITSMHTGTHMNAPLHLIQKGADLAAISPERYFGNGAVLDVPKKNWEVITAADLQNAKPEVKEGDIIIIVTGWHHKYSDGIEYYGEAPGLSKDAAEWLVSKNPKMVGCRHTTHRPSASHLDGSAPRRPADETPRRLIQEGDGSRLESRASGVEHRAQDSSRRGHPHP